MIELLAMMLAPALIFAALGLVADWWEAGDARRDSHRRNHARRMR